MSLAAEDAAGAEGVPDALIHAVFQWNFVIDTVSVKATDLNHHDDKVGIFDRFFAIGRRPGFRGEIVIGNHPVCEGFHPAQLRLRRRH